MEKDKVVKVASVARLSIAEKIISAEDAATRQARDECKKKAFAEVEEEERRVGGNDRRNAEGQGDDAKPEDQDPGRQHEMDPHIETINEAPDATNHYETARNKIKDCKDQAAVAADGACSTTSRCLHLRHNDREGANPENQLRGKK